MQGISLSLSFSSYSNAEIAEIAARIVGESDSDDFSGEGGFSDDEFEFSVVPTDSEIPLLDSADEVFKNGKIRSAYPVFNRDLLLGDLNFHGGNEEVRNSESPKIRLPLRKLFLEERETTLTTSSSSSSESDNLDGLTGENYCVWPPKSAAEEKRRSSAGGKSKRGKLKDFLRRSNSDGILTSLAIQFHRRKKEIKNKVTDTPAECGKVKSTAAPAPPLYNWHGGDKQQSYVMDRQDLAGIFVV